MLKNTRYFLAHQRRNTLKYAPHEPVEGNMICFLDLTSELNHIGRVTIELFTDVVPRTAENFRSLTTGERGSSNGCVLSFKGTPFHRIVPGFVLQGGDVRHRDGRGCESIFGYPFKDESFTGKAGKNLCGTLAMSNDGPNRNGSQFFFNMRDSPHLDGRFVVFGQVLNGWDHVISVSAEYGSRCGTPLRKVWVSDCGQTAGAKFEDLADIPADPARNHLPGKEVLEMFGANVPGAEFRR